jgi:iron complex transport system ATP-binding protein
MSKLWLSSVSVSLSGAPILRGVDGELGAGEWLSLIGPNGAGKSTLLRAVAGLVAYDGSVTIDGAEVARLGRRAAARRLAFVPQTPLLPPEMSVVEYVLLGRTPHLGYLASESRGDRRAVDAALDRLDLGHFAGRRLGSLSGGEAQRTVLARALAQEAPLLVLDEPTTALDVGRQQQVLELIEELRHEHGLTVLSAMHDLTLAGQYAERLLLLAGGRVVATGAPAEVLSEQRIARFYQARVHVLDSARAFAVVPYRTSPRVPAATGANTR